MNGDASKVEAYKNTMVEAFHDAMEEWYAGS